MNRFAAILAITALAAPLCYGQSQSELRKVKKQRALEMKESIRNSGFDRNRNGVLSAVERKRWERAVRAMIAELERQSRDRDDEDDKKRDDRGGK